MTTKLQTLTEAAQEAVKSARTIAETAEAAQRPLTGQEKSDYDTAMAKGRDLLEQIKVVKADEAILADAKSLADEIGPLAVADLEAQGKGSNPGTKAENLGLQVCSSAQFKAMIAPFKGGRIPEKARLQSDPIAVKSLITGGSSTSAGAFVVPEQTGIIELLGRRDLTLRDLISVRRTGSDTVEYVRQISHTNAAAVVAEATTAASPTAPVGGGALVRAAGGGYKPQGSWEFVRETATVKTIAEWVPASKRALADVAQLEGLINDELRADIAETEEDQILNGDGEGENLEGILSTSGIQTQAFVGNIFTSVRKGLTKARTVGRVRPNGILLNPIDAEAVDLARENGDTGKYFGGGPFATGAKTLWGVPYVETEAQPEGFATLGDFSKAVLWDREQSSVTMTDSHEDFFIRNLVAILGEERVAFGVTRPSAFVQVDVAA